MVTQKRLKEVLDYNPETGIFTRKGKAAGTINHNGYIVISVDTNRIMAHRLAWVYMYGEIPNVIDHINKVRTDNSIMNLRNVDCAINSKNMKQNKNNKTGVVGVSWSDSQCKWIAEITVNLTRIRLGSYSDIYLAIRARADAEKKHNFHPTHGDNSINYEYINEKQKLVNYNKMGDANKREVHQLSKDGNFIMMFNSAKEAQDATGVNRAHISSVCKGKRKTAGGFKWCYSSLEFIQTLEN